LRIIHYTSGTYHETTVELTHEIRASIVAMPRRQAKDRRARNHETAPADPSSVSIRELDGSMQSDTSYSSRRKSKYERWL